MMCPSLGSRARMKESKMHEGELLTTLKRFSPGGLVRESKTRKEK